MLVQAGQCAKHPVRWESGGLSLWTSLLREGAFFPFARRAVYMQVTTGPRLLMTQVISLECLLRLPRGSLQHHNVLSATRTPRDLRRRAPPRAPRQRRAQDTQAPASTRPPAQPSCCAVNQLPKTPFQKALIGSVCQFPRCTCCHHGQVQVTKMISTEELQRNAHNKPAQHIADPLPGAVTITAHQAPAVCQALH